MDPTFIKKNKSIKLYIRILNLLKYCEGFYIDIEPIGKQQMIIKNLSKLIKFCNDPECIKENSYLTIYLHFLNN